jgi:hypothetical protein
MKALMKIADLSGVRRSRRMVNSHECSISCSSLRCRQGSLDELIVSDSARKEIDATIALLSCTQQHKSLAEQRLVS